ncbi:hypothetical protein BDZ90DRAFT_176636 [Jaminaea rosea]|uniref:Uncharacterized protein n=1 Tax=Jaminaea rosea TaxID=1569628 RepID=A0A316URG1_9BASI|nr:hypothetical protein BDZ90DRAFT_176636 [Jaminaea rosea]PWN27368.1 hypothetical protein BDZ90DRAFT_176636 [Jaminaea rosea]
MFCFKGGYVHLLAFTLTRHIQDNTMTPDTPNKAPLDKGQRARSESAGADEWRPDGQEAAAGNQDSDDLAEEDSEDSGKEYGSPKKSKKRTARATSAPKTPKRGKVGSSLQSSPRSSSRAPSSGWSQGNSSIPTSYFSSPRSLTFAGHRRRRAPGSLYGVLSAGDAEHPYHLPGAGTRGKVQRTGQHEDES